MTPNSRKNPDDDGYVQDRLEEIRAWRARMVVSQELAGRDRNQEFEDGKIAVFQHTLDDYDFLLNLIDEGGSANRLTAFKGK